MFRTAEQKCILKNIKRDRCSSCGLYGCICQLALKDWVETRKIIVEPSWGFKVLNCPSGCLNATKECLDCYDFDKFKGMIIL